MATFHESEKARLLDSASASSSSGNDKRNFFSYGTYKYQHEDLKSPDEKKTVDAKRIGITKLFRYATKSDLVVLAIGTVATIIHGAGLPLLAMVFGNMTNSFILQTLYGFANETVSTTTPISDLVVSSVSPGTTTTVDPSIFRYVNGTISPLIVQYLLTREEFVAEVARMSLYYLCIGVLVFISSFIQAMCWEISCERQAFRLRKEFFYQVLRQEISWYDHHQSGDLAMKLSDDLERIREGIGHKFSMIIQYTSAFVSGFVVGFLINWQLTLVILALTPLLAGTAAFSGRIIATQSAREQQKYGKAGAVAEEVLSCMKTVASFGGEEREIRRYISALSDGLHLAIKKYHVLAIGLGLTFFVMYGSYSLAFWYGCQLLLKNAVTPGDIFTVFFGVLVGAFSLGYAIPFVATVSQAQGAGAVIFKVIDSQPVIDPYSRIGLLPDSVTGKIQFRNIYFRYPSRPEVSILRKFNLEIEPGKTVAIVGASGAGKSTIISLILRFYDPESGSILLDGFDLKALNLAWLRHHIGVVSQEPVLFGTTIYENISYGRDFVTPDEVVTAARMANAHDFISSLPRGYETVCGERGAQLSGGQKQRIAIARALVRDPRILLLDEATSALDSKSEALVQAALDKARQGRTTIIVAHRLSTIKDADVIYALKDGMIVEFGTHSQLMDKEGLYFELATAQASFSSADDINEGDASAESTEESIQEYDYEVEKRQRRRTRGQRMKVRGQLLADPDKSRLLIESKELNVKYPGMIKILKMNAGEWHLLLGGFIGSLITGAVMPIFAMYYAEMFATFTLQGDELANAGVFWALMFLTLAAVSGFGFWLRTIFVASAGEYMTMKLRAESFIGVIRQPVGWFEKPTNSPGRLSTRLARDAPMVKSAAGHRLAVVIASFVTIVISLGAAFIMGWQLALVLSAAFPLLMFAGYIQIKNLKGGQKKDAMLMEDAGRIAIEAIQNIRTVQSISQEKLFFQKYLEFLLPAYMESQRQGIVYGFAFAFAEAILFVVYAGSFYYGGILIGDDAMTTLAVFRVFFTTAFCAVAVGQATSFLPDYTKANLAAALIFNLIESKSPIDPFSPEGLRPAFEGRITFNEVHFRYPSRDEFRVLQGLSFDLQPGQTLAIVGPSGCGKSTVVSLLERFYDVTGGQVMIDGYDLRSLNISHLRLNIGLVTQEPILFDCTIRENIEYGYGIKGHVPEDLVYEAAKSANIHNFIVGLPQGYSTLVGERGTQLSGGQKQRIAIARALIRDPKILLLDEATSALDSESEKIVQEALDRARAGRTCIIIAHRLSTIQNADCIAVLNRGKIVEIGTHDQLRARRGIYFKLTKDQQISH